MIGFYCFYGFDMGFVLDGSPVVFDSDPAVVIEKAFRDETGKNDYSEEYQTSQK